MAAKRRHWKEKDGRFWACISIPEALRPVFGKTQLTEPLGGDLRIANRNHAAAVARLQALLDAARRPASEVARVRPLSDDDRERLIWEHYQAVLAQIEAKRAAMPTPAEIDAEYELAMQRVEAGDTGFNYAVDYELAAGARFFDRNLRGKRLVALRAAIPTGDTRLVDGAVADYANSNGIHMEKDGPEWRVLAGALIRAEIEALERSVEFDRGEVAGTIKDPLVRPPAKQAGKVPIRKLFEDYVASRQAVGLHRDGGKNWSSSIERLIGFLKHDNAAMITKRSLLDWRDAMLAEGLSAKTISDKHLAAIRAVLRWAFENDRLESNPMVAVSQDVPRKLQNREKGYTEKEALAVLRASLGYLPGIGSKESAWITAAKRWVPLLCAFTGARVTEMAQLRKEDVREEDGRWVIRITPDAGSVKTRQYRDVPLHRQIVDLGFAEFVKAAGDGPLFHGAREVEKYVASARVTSGRLSEWLNEAALVPDGVQPSYGWRHRFKTLGLELGLSDRVMDCVQGHPGKTASDGYGDVSLTAKLRVIDALAGFDL